eukprot:TRINITY_DN4819_c0_g2_i4.p1 TRINITY_DN4819_c0_g2~~TRINITY_DN4819_c0_g2_i4.p1  ORF type:complete len:691 (+),score=60.23 TRINITY_DN4819_c0_g2_i4:1785-3857(+)
MDLGDCIQTRNVPLTSNFTQYGTRRYWNVKPSVSAGMINIYSLNLEASDEPGTFYVGTTQGQSMPNLYISSNCTSTCTAYTSTPTSQQQCWNTSSFTAQHLTTYINVNPKQFCSTYFSLENATGTEQLIIAYFPASFPILTSSSNQTILFPWQNYPAPRYLIPVMNYSAIQHATFTSKFKMFSIDLLNVSQTPSLGNHTIYLASKDPYICQGQQTELFPGPNGGCNQVGISSAVVNGTQVDNVEYHLEYATSGVQMAIYGKSSSADPNLNLIYTTEFHCVSPSIQVNGTCIIYQEPNITNLTPQVINSTKGNYWNLTLTATGEAQLFELDLNANNLPGAFYWSNNQIYPTVYVVTNCSSSCSYNASMGASTSNYCATTPSGTATAWSMTTDSTISTQCYLQFYLQANITTSQTFQFMYSPETIVSDGNNTAIFNWNPALFRYFKYNFSTIYQAIPYAQYGFTLSINQQVNTIYFGTTDSNQQCNYPLPSQGAQCQDITTTTTNVTRNYQLTLNNSNSVIYLAMSSSSAIAFTITPSFTCYTGYYQPTGQMTCKVKGACNAGSYYDETQNQCVECSKALSNCALCVSSTTCTECTNSQFTITNGKCVAVCTSGQYPNPIVTTAASICLPCMQHCVSCTSGTDCQECYEPTYVWSAVNKNCSTVCPGGGKYYDANTKGCINCEVQYLSLIHI